MMEFLVIGRSTQFSEPDAEYLAMIRQGIQQFQDDTRTKAFYGFAGEWGGCLICDVGSATELDQYLTLNPLGMMTEWEIHPLTAAADILKTMEMFEKHVQNMKPAA